MINFAHRGFKGKYPENTKLAFSEAIKTGANGIELDVHLTKDGQLVVIHDETLDRTTDGSGLVCDNSLCELKKLNASKLYPKYDRQEIPTLKEYFEFIKNFDIVTNVELKNSIIDYKNIEELTYDLIREYDLEDKVIISSFNHESLVRFKELDENIKCGVLEDAKLYKAWDYVKSLEMDYFHPMNFTVDQKIADKCMEYGIGLNIWFGVSDYDYSKCLKYQPTGLITDYPDRVNNLM